jgi:hypothetical protein
LARLDYLNYENKENKKEVLALLGELAGMIRALAEHSNGYKICYEDLVKWSTNSEGFSEPRKRQISQELHALLDDQSLSSAITLIKNSNG